MSIQPILIDNIAFAKRSEHLAGTLLLADCTRLSELLQAQASGKVSSANTNNTFKSEELADNLIHYILDGEVNAMGQYFLHLSVTASLVAMCQRCLEAMPLKLDLNFHYLISDNKLNTGDVEESDDYDIQEASQAMDLMALIEDEMIMALPIAPTHESGCVAALTESGEKPNPFAVLKGLIKS